MCAKTKINPIQFVLNSTEYCNIKFPRGNAMLENKNLPVCNMSKSD